MYFVVKRYLQTRDSVRQTWTFWEKHKLIDTYIWGYILLLVVLLFRLMISEWAKIHIFIPIFFSQLFWFLNCLSCFDLVADYCLSSVIMVKMKMTKNSGCRSTFHTSKSLVLGSNVITSIVNLPRQENFWFWGDLNDVQRKIIDISLKLK